MDIVRDLARLPVEPFLRPLAPPKKEDADLQLRVDGPRGLSCIPVAASTKSSLSFQVTVDTAHSGLTCSVCQLSPSMWPLRV
jgi:hypothetical protein